LRIAQKAPVVYVAAEGQSGYPQRVAAWEKHNRQKAGNAHFFFDPLSLTMPAELESFIADLAPVAPAFIVVDTVAQTMTGADENSARDMGLYIRACQRLAKSFDCAVMLVHHTNKGGIEERGSGALRGASDTMLRLTPEDDLLILECSKSKDYRPFETRYYRQVRIELGTDEEGFPMDSLVLVAAEKVEPDSENLTNNQIKVLRILSDPLNEEGLSLGDLVELTSINRVTLWRVVSSLFKFGYIAKEGRGKPYTITPQGIAKVS